MCGAIILLDDRGWGVSGPPNLWQTTIAAEIEDQARTVVGPDKDETSTEYWAPLVAILRRAGVTTTAAELAALPHDVELGEQITAALHNHQL